MDRREVPPPYIEIQEVAPSAPTNKSDFSQFQSSGYAPISSPTFEPPYLNSPIQNQPQVVPSVTTTVHVSGNAPAVAGSCPVCSNRSWTGTYSCCAWFLCLFCFWNFGLCCCLCMRKKKCTKCGFTIN